MFSAFEPIFIRSGAPRREEVEEATPRIDELVDDEDDEGQPVVETVQGVVEDDEEGPAVEEGRRRKRKRKREDRTGGSAVNIARRGAVADFQATSRASPFEVTANTTMNINAHPNLAKPD